MTPSECVSAVEYGADFVKIFPASNLGVDYLKAIKSPLSHIRFIPTGGITPENIPLFMSVGASAFGIGSNLINNKIVANGEFNLLRKNAQTFVNAVNEAE